MQHHATAEVTPSTNLIIILIFYLIACNAAPAQAVFGINLLMAAGFFLSVRGSSYGNVIAGPMILILLVGLLATVYWGNGSKIDDARVLYYNTFPIIALFSGFLFASSQLKIKNLYLSISIAGTILSLLYILIYFYHGAQLANRNELRSTYGTGYFVSALSFAILFARSRAIGLPRSVGVPLALLSLLSIYLSASRSNLLCAVIYVVFFWIKPPRTRTFACIVAIVTVALSILTTPLLFGFISTTALEAVVKGGPTSLAELMPAFYFTSAEVNSHWRGFEVAQVFNHVISHGTFATMFGMGYGELVPLGMEISLGGNLMSRIGRFHSGFSHVFLRAGLVGILLFSLQAYVFCRQASRSAGKSDELARLLYASTVCCVATMPIEAGLYHFGDSGLMLAFLIGFLIWRCRALLKISYLRGKSGDAFAPAKEAIKGRLDRPV